MWKGKLTPTITFHEQLWPLIARHAKHLSGPEVVVALQMASDKIYDLGFDEVYRLSVKNPDHDLANAFDFTWMTAFILELEAMKRKKK